MSRIGKQPIKIESGIDLKIEKLPNGVNVSSTGKLGSLTQFVPAILSVVEYEEEGSKYIKVEPSKPSKESVSMWGLYRTLLQNNISGVESGYTKNLEIVGIGYRAEMKGTSCVFSLGLSHKITFAPPEGISISVVDQTNVSIFGFDKQLVGEVAAKIRAFRKPEPYKGKGVRYKDEVVRRKSTKAGK